MSRARKGLLIAAGAVLLGVFLFGDTGVSLYSELEWFRSLGQEDRFWTLAMAQVATWTATFLLAAGGLYWLLTAELRRSGPLHVKRRLGDLEIAEALPENWVRWTLRGASVVVGLLVAAPVADTLGRQILAALHSAPWGESDAILGRDPRFYVFYLPVARGVWSLALSWLVWASLSAGAFFLLSGQVRSDGEKIRMDDSARRTLIYLGVGLLVLLSAHFWISVFEQVSGGPIRYADVHGELPVRRLLGVLALLAAAATVYGERTGKWSVTLSTVGIFVAAWPLGLGVYPDLIQRFRVEPNEYQLEREFIRADIEATRRAFDLDDVQTRDYAVRETDPPPFSVVERWTEGLPLWDERPLQSTFNQLQGLLAYHGFPDVDNDRYGSGSDREQVAIAVREFSPQRLDQSARTWQNLHLRYTHGTGVVASPVDSIVSGGAPAYFLRDLPPVLTPPAPPDLQVDEPRFYFGELTIQYVLEDPDSLPGGERTTGVTLDGLVEKAVFAWALGAKNILLRQEPGGSLLMWRRDVVSRVQALVPFLYVDRESPYPVVEDGRIRWIVDAYTHTRRYPLSQPALYRGQRVNYLRNSVKAVVDGVTGEVSLYAVQPEDPILATYRDAFPELFEPLEEMPDDMRDHLRYPRTLLETQAGLLNAYHMTDPEAFYRRQDLWSVGQEMYENDTQAVEPYYLLMPFPADEGGEGELRDEFLLTVPFTPRDRDNLSSFLMARNDGEHYGDLWIFDVETTEQVFGPRQIEVQIDQDPRISEQLSLWRQLGSQAVRGHLLMVPIRGFLLYVEPLFLRAEDETGAAPGLKRVIAAAGDQVSMALTLDAALRRLLANLGADVEAPDEPAVIADTAGVPAPTDTAAAARPAREAPAGTGAALERIRRLTRQAESALQAGDLSRFADLWQQIRDAAAAADTASASP